MKDIELGEKIRNASTRFEYFVNLKSWVDGYIMAAERAVIDQQAIDQQTLAAVTALRERMAQVIISDAVSIAALSLDGEKRWAQPLVHD